MSNTNNSPLAQPLTLPCGAVIPNRLCKAAMTEGLATPDGLPTPELDTLYRIWSEGGSGLLISGNLLIDQDHLERPGNVIVDSEPSAAMHTALQRWAEAATAGGNHFWAQINHAGRQTQKPINPNPKAPSPIALGLPGGQFGDPVALTVTEIEDIVQRFAQCARAMQSAGFTGVQIHAAHGYLLSQFLSPRSNQRDDQYGGALENRARVLLEVVDAVRERVGPEFPVSVKLNSADFQKGGFAFEESLQVAQWLETAGVDLLEISGGTYEQPRLLGLEGLEAVEPQGVAESTQAREAYFVDFALAMQKVVSIPLMVTGGLRQRAVMESIINEGSAQMIGLGRPLCMMTDGSAQLLQGLQELPRYEDTLNFLPKWLSFLNRIDMIRTAATFGTQFWYYGQIHALGTLGKARPKLKPMRAARELMDRDKQWLAARKRSCC